jgi:hypothetical protein
MKRSSFGPRTTPLKRGSWKSSPSKQTDWRSELRSGGIKRKARKPTVAEGSKYLAACKGEDCYLRVPSQCRRIPNDETVVPCHENSLAAGKGMGLKSDHRRTVPGCFWCHSWLDQGKGTREEKAIVFKLAYAEWEPVRARKMGLVEELTEAF